MDRRDPLADELIKIIKKVRQKTQMYEHKGTYRLRAWMVPGDELDEEPALPKGSARPFGRQGP